MPMKGKIGPGDQRNLMVNFHCFEEITVKQDIQLKIRGGQILKIPFNAIVSIPNVYIVEDIIDFGDIRYGNKGTINITLRNDSDLIATIILDLRDNKRA